MNKELFGLKAKIDNEKVTILDGYPSLSDHMNYDFVVVNNHGECKIVNQKKLIIDIPHLNKKRTLKEQQNITESYDRFDLIDL